VTLLKAVIFDLDGVLIDSEPLMRFAFEKTYRRMIGPDQAPIDAYLDHMGESFPRIMDHLGLPHSLWEPYRKLCQKHINRISLFPEGPILLQKLRALGLKLAVLTGKDRVRTLQTLDHFNIRYFFQEVVASDQLRVPKPDPEGILHTLKLLDCATNEAVMIGDSVSDILCAQRAEVTSIAVTWGIKPERVQTLCVPDYIVHDWVSLTKVLLLLCGSMSTAGMPLSRSKRTKTNRNGNGRRTP
jgi:3-amino-5-hydroxybenzoic acid synthesis related protein